MILVIILISNVRIQIDIILIIRIIQTIEWTILEHVIPMNIIIDERNHRVNAMIHRHIEEILNSIQPVYMTNRHTIIRIDEEMIGTIHGIGLFS